MDCKRIDIANLYNLEGVASLEVFKEIEYLDTGRLEKMPAMVVVPGGGYGMVSKREGLPVAMEYLINGFIPFILTYSVGEEYCYPQQLLELAASVDYIRKNADEFGVDVDKIYVVGFSAGGHLVANLGVEYLELQEKYDAKPNGVCLCYPVISREYGASGWTYENLLRKYNEEEKELLLKKLSFTNSNLTNFPPCFIWTTANDDCVMSQNSIMFTSKLVEAGVKCEFHMYPNGWHGLSVANELVNSHHDFLAKIRTWVGLSVDFFKSL